MKKIFSIVALCLLTIFILVSCGENDTKNTNSKTNFDIKKDDQTKYDSNQITVKVIYNENEKNDIEIIKIKKGQNIKLTPKYDTYKHHYIFDNWYYLDSDIIFDFQNPIYKDITIVGKYKPKEYKITFDTSEVELIDENSIPEQLIEYGKTYAYTLKYKTKNWI